MGAYLTSPHTEIESETGEGNGLQFAVGSMQGWRKNQEDAHVACTDLSIIKKMIAETEHDTQCSGAKEMDTTMMSAFGVFDGHGGKEVSIFVADRILKELHKLESFRESRVEDSLQEIFHHLDDLLVDPENFKTLQGYRARKNPSDLKRSRVAGGGRKITGVAGRSLKLADTNNEGISSALTKLEKAQTDKGKETKKEVDVAEQYKNAIVAVPNSSSDSSSSSNAENKEEIESRLVVTATAVATTGTSDSATETEEGNDEDDERMVNSDTAKRFLKQILSDRLSSSELERALKELDSDKKLNNSNNSKKEEGIKGVGEVVTAGAGVDKKASEAPTVAPAASAAPVERVRAASIRTVPVSEVSKSISGVKRCQLPNHKINAGCTANFALIDHAAGRLYVANAGDSRAVLCRAGQAIALSVDHKPTDAKEHSRVAAAGGFVSSVGRINNNLNLSRSIGDLKYKQVKDLGPHEQLVTAEPDVVSVVLDPDNDEFVVLACDGVWDVMSNQGICDFVRERLTKWDQVQGQPSALFDADGRRIGEVEEEEEEEEEETVAVSQDTDVALPPVVTSSSDITPTIVPIKSIVADVFQHCIADSIDSTAIGGDNMTCILVVFDKFLDRIRANAQGIRRVAAAAVQVSENAEDMITDAEIAMD